VLPWQQKNQTRFGAVWRNSWAIFPEFLRECTGLYAGNEMGVFFKKAENGGVL